MYSLCDTGQVVGTCWSLLAAHPGELTTGPPSHFVVKSQSQGSVNVQPWAFCHTHTGLSSKKLNYWSQFTQSSRWRQSWH